jgi:spiro-SPASM protein
MKSGIITAEDFMEKHKSLDEHCRTVPNYYQIQISSSCPQSCSYCPYPAMNPHHRSDKSEMSIHNILKLAESIEAFTPEARISLSLWGEPAMHSDIKNVLTSLIQKSSLNLVIESSGIGWGNLETPEMAEILESDRIEWIFSLDAMDSNLYKQLRGDGQEEALSMIEKMLTVNPERTWVQAVRMKENEDDLEEFYRFWKEKTNNVIIQKYDHFSKSLPEKKITDLSPLKRFPCWHLKREMAILVDGSVVRCREDINGIHQRENCFEVPLESIWNNGRTLYNEHLNEEYKGVCAGCDEYYSYNF